MLYYEEFGDRQKPTIILLPGAGMAPTFARQYRFLAENYHLVLIHILGTGKASSQLWSLQKNVDGVLQIVKKVSKEKVTLCGFSLGAQLTVALVCKEPELFRKAVIVSAWLIKPPKETKRLVKLIKFVSFFENRPFFLKRAAKTLQLNKRQAKEFVSDEKHSRLENIERYNCDGVELSKYPQFADVKIPMLALCGANEDHEMMIQSAVRLGEMNPNCRTMILQNHAHDIPFKNPEEFNRILKDFLEND